MSTGRLEAFSDGVIAVAITLLVLDIRVPSADPHHTLAHELLDQWPAYAAYATSFITIGIIWVNHHAQIGRLQRADHGLLMLNLLLLMSICLIPFATSLMAAYLKNSHGQDLAAGVYAGSLLLMALAFSAVNYHVLLRRPELLRQPLTAPQRRGVFLRALTGVVPYALATALAAVSPYVTLAVTSVIAAYYALPFATSHDT